MRRSLKVLLAIFALGFLPGVEQAKAASNFLLTPLDQAVLLPNPYLSVDPSGPAEGYAQLQQSTNGDLRVGVRMVSMESGSEKSLKATIFFRNNSFSTKQIAPRLEIIDANGMVVQVLDLTSLREMAARASRQQFYGGQFFVPIAGTPRSIAENFLSFAVNNLIAGASHQHNTKQAQKITDTIDRWWIKSSYTLSPGTWQAAFVWSNYLPQLPMKLKLTVDGETFTFSTVKSLDEAERNNEAAPDQTRRAEEFYSH